MLQIIKNEEKEFNEESIEIVPRFSFNQKKTINRIYLYYNSKYESGEFDDQGDKKYFYNIVRNPCNVATKAVDFDTKHINIYTAGGGDPLTTWFFEKDLKDWMKEQKFGAVLNRLFYELPIFGSVVLKIIDGKIYFVDLRNFIVEQSADSLDKANYIIEIHNYTPIEFRQVASKMGWDKTEEVLNEFYEDDNAYIRVYERYGELDGKLSVVFVADVGKDIYDEKTGEIIPHRGVILGQKEISGLPYREFHWEKLPGRWLGIGRVEVLFDPQVRVNEVSNQQVKSSYWSTLRLWQVADEGFDRNLLTQAENGEVLHVEEEIKQVDMTDRNLAHYGQEINRWLTNRDELTFSYDIMRGERLPAGTPLGSAQLSAYQSGSYFEQIRENIAINVKELLYDVIIPHFKRERSIEHILVLSGGDLDKVRNIIIENAVHNKLLEFIHRNGRIPEGGEMQIIKEIVSENIKRHRELRVVIPSGYYDNLKYKIDIDIVGEAIDTRVRAANKWMALQAISTDPALLTNPTKRRFFSSWLEDGGLSLMDFDNTPSSDEELPKVGGGISKPIVPEVPVAGTLNTKI